jgi:hypothetical protein
MGGWFWFLVFYFVGAGVFLRMELRFKKEEKEEEEDYNAGHFPPPPLLDINLAPERTARGKASKKSKAGVKMGHANPDQINTRASFCAKRF